MSTHPSYSMATMSAADGTPLALHRWAPPATPARGLLYYVHGIQSHAGWLFETGPELARRGVVTYALDRRGSGRSGGARGDLPSAPVTIGDYLDGLRAAVTAEPRLPLTVLGQSFGGSVVAAAAVTGNLPADRIVYCTPALGQQRARHDPDRLARIRGLTGLEYSPVALDDEDYTDQTRYLEFMANDHLMLRQITDRGRATMVALEDSYMDERAPTGPDVHLVRVRRDPIIALDVSERVLRTVHDGFSTATFAADHHYLEFSAARREYWTWLGELVTTPVPEPARRGER